MALLELIKSIDDPFVAKLACFWAEETAQSDGPLDTEEITMFSVVVSLLGLHPDGVRDWITRTVDALLGGNLFSPRRTRFGDRVVDGGAPRARRRRDR